MRINNKSESLNINCKRNEIIIKCTSINMSLQQLSVLFALKFKTERKEKYGAKKNRKQKETEKEADFVASLFTQKQSNCHITADIAISLHFQINCDQLKILSLRHFNQ